MKFVNPELEVTLFSVEDILTTSTPDEPTELSQAESLSEGECCGTKADDFLSDCI